MKYRNTKLPEGQGKNPRPAKGAAGRDPDQAPLFVKAYRIEMRDPSMTMDEKGVLWSIRSLSDWNTGECRATNDEIAAGCGMPTRKMQRALAKLAARKNSPIAIVRKSRRDRVAIIDLTVSGSTTSANLGDGNGKGEVRKERRNRFARNVEVGSTNPTKVNVDASTANPLDANGLHRPAATPSDSSSDSIQIQDIDPLVLHRDGEDLGGRGGGDERVQDLTTSKQSDPPRPLRANLDPSDDDEDGDMEARDQAQTANPSRPTSSSSAAAGGDDEYPDAREAVRDHAGRDDEVQEVVQANGNTMEHPGDLLGDAVDDEDVPVLKVGKVRCDLTDDEIDFRTREMSETFTRLDNITPLGIECPTCRALFLGAELAAEEAHVLKKLCVDRIHPKEWTQGEKDIATQLRLAGLIDWDGGPVVNPPFRWAGERVRHGGLGGRARGPGQLFLALGLLDIRIDLLAPCRPLGHTAAQANMA